MDKKLERDLRTGNDILQLLTDYDSGLLTKEETMGIVFLQLSKARSDGHKQGWNGAEKYLKKKFKIID